MVQKKKNNQGFTLAELLIVVAIIALLVAIAIPVLRAQLDKARLAVDQSAVRSAKSVAAAEYLSDGLSGEKTYYYTGSTVVTSLDGMTINGYGKSDINDDDGDKTGAKGNPKDSLVIVTIASDGSISAAWSGGGSNPITPTKPGSVDNNPLNNGAYSVNNQIFKWMTTWQKIGDNKKFKIGEYFVENDTLYVNINSKDGSPAIKEYEQTVDDFISNNKDSLAIISKGDPVLSVSDMKDDFTCERGTLIRDGVNYYIAIKDITSNVSLKDDGTNWTILK